MSYSYFGDFAAMYASPIPNRELEKGNYFGFNLSSGNSGHYHVHCKTFVVKSKDEVWLYINKTLITISKIHNVLSVDSCKSNYWEIDRMLFARD